LAGNCDSRARGRIVRSHRWLPLWLPENGSPAGLAAVRDRPECSDVRGRLCRNRMWGPSAARAMQEVKDHLQDQNMPLTWENVELRGFEPLTSCMPYKPEPWLDVAGSGSTSSFNRCMSLDVARHRRSLAPLPGFSDAAPPTARPQETEPKPRSYCPSGLARRHGRHTPPQIPGCAGPPSCPTRLGYTPRNHSRRTPVLLHAARHEQPHRPVITEVRRFYAHACR
jgi:hypothetical protein